MDATQRMRELMNERGWTEYRLAINAGLAQATITSIFKRNALPSITTVEAICKAFGITMSQFFTPPPCEEPVYLDLKQREMVDKFSFLTDNQKDLILKMVDELNSK